MLDEKPKVVAQTHAGREVGNPVDKRKDAKSDDEKNREQAQNPVAATCGIEHAEQSGLQCGEADRTKHEPTAVRTRGLIHRDIYIADECDDEQHAPKRGGVLHESRQARLDSEKHVS